MNDSQVKTIIIPEWKVEEFPLGRHVEHDERSRAFGIAEIGFKAVRPTVKVDHLRYGAILDQGNLGSCTGNATAHAMNTLPIHKLHHHIYTEADAINIYKRATVLDPFPGTYPPEDTGSSGLSACKAAQERGWISNYRHAFGIEEALAALVYGPVITGVNWYEGFDHPDSNGRIVIAGQIRGGHEFEVKGYDPSTDLVHAINSWSKVWGHFGHFYFTSKTWATLLEQDGDVTILVP